MNETEARAFRAESDAYAKSIYRKTIAVLRVIYRDLLAADGIQMLHGGPAGRDELVNAIVYYKYPVEKMNEATHVLHHGPGECWSACEWCHPHQGERCDCAIGRATA